MERPLGFGERIALRVHLGVCRGCSNFVRQVEFLRRALRQIDEPPAARDQST